MTSSIPSPPPLARAALEQAYRYYIAAICTGSVGSQLYRYCHGSVTYNGRALSRAEYQANIDAAFEHMPDCSFAIERLAVDAEQQCVAARLAISGTLAKPWEGTGLDGPVGAKVLVHEHVMYWFEGGRIADVLTLIKFPGRETVQP